MQNNAEIPFPEGCRNFRASSFPCLDSSPWFSGDLEIFRRIGPGFSKMRQSIAFESEFPHIENYSFPPGM